MAEEQQPVLVKERRVSYGIGGFGNIRTTSPFPLALAPRPALRRIPSRPE